MYLLRHLVLLSLIFFSFFLYAEKDLEEILSHGNDLFFINSLKNEDIVLLKEKYKDTTLNIFERQKIFSIVENKKRLLIWKGLPFVKRMKKTPKEKIDILISIDKKASSKEITLAMYDVLGKNQIGDLSNNTQSLLRSWNMIHFFLNNISLALVEQEEKSLMSLIKGLFYQWGIQNKYVTKDDLLFEINKLENCHGEDFFWMSLPLTMGGIIGHYKELFIRKSHNKINATIIDNKEQVFSIVSINESEALANLLTNNSRISDSDLYSIIVADSHLPSLEAPQLRGLSCWVQSKLSSFKALFIYFPYMMNSYIHFLADSLGVNVPTSVYTDIFVDYSKEVSPLYYSERGFPYFLEQKLRSDIIIYPKEKINLFISSIIRDDIDKFYGFIIGDRSLLYKRDEYGLYPLTWAIALENKMVISAIFNMIVLKENDDTLKEYIFEQARQLEILPKQLITNEIDDVMEKFKEFYKVDILNDFNYMLSLFINSNYKKLSEILSSGEMINFNLEDKQTKRTLGYALLKDNAERYSLIIQLYQKDPLDLTKKDVNQNNIFHIIFENKDNVDSGRNLFLLFESATHLLNEKNIEGVTPFYNNLPYLIKYIKYKIGSKNSVDDLNILEKNGPMNYTYLHKAAQENNLKAVEAIVKMASLSNKHSLADVLDAQNNYGVTPLQLAAAKNNIPIVEALLKAGANPNIEATYQRPALNAFKMAIEHDSVETARIIEEYQYAHGHQDVIQSDFDWYKAHYSNTSLFSTRVALLFPDKNI